MPPDPKEGVRDEVRKEELRRQRQKQRPRNSKTKTKKDKDKYKEVEQEEQTDPCCRYTKKCKSTPKKNCKTVYQQKCTKQPVQNCKNEQVLRNFNPSFAERFLCVSRSILFTCKIIFAIVLMYVWWQHTSGVPHFVQGGVQTNVVYLCICVFMHLCICVFAKVHIRCATRRTRRSANRRTTTNSRARASRSRSAATRRSAPPGEQITFVRSEFFLHFHFVPVSVNLRFLSLLALFILLEGYVIPPGTSWKIYWLFLLKQLMSVFSFTLWLLCFELY